MIINELTIWFRIFHTAAQIRYLLCNQTHRLFCFVNSLGKKDEEEIRFLSRGDYFGEQALLKTDFRTANVIANTKSVECLMLDRE